MQISQPKYFLPTCSLLIFLVFTCIFALTTARYPINIADSNELMTAAYTHGIAHPPQLPTVYLVPGPNYASLQL